MAIGTITDEHAARTLDSLRVLPVPLPRLFFYKWLFGFATVVLPLTLAELLCYGFLPKSHYGSQGLVSFINGVMTVASAASIYTWTVALGIRFTKEHRVALMATSRYRGSGLLTGVELNPFFRGGAIEYIWCIIMPVGVLTKSGHDGVPGVAFILIPVLHLPVMAALYYWSSRRFGLNRSIRRPSALRSAVFPAIEKLRARRNPILWKTWKEIGWIWAWYLGVSFGLLLAVEIYFQYESLYARYITVEWLRSIANETTTVAGIVSYAGFFLAIATGAEIGMGDFERGVDRFLEIPPHRIQSLFPPPFSLRVVFSDEQALILPILLNFWSRRGATGVVQLSSPRTIWRHSRHQRHKSAVNRLDDLVVRRSGFQRATYALVSNVCGFYPRARDGDGRNRQRVGGRGGGTGSEVVTRISTGSWATARKAHSGR